MLVAGLLTAPLSGAGASARPIATPPEEPPAEIRSPIPLPLPELELIEDDRLSFSYPVAAEHGGGTVTGKAGGLESPEPQRIVLHDRVELRYKDLIVRADRVELDLETNRIRARGHIVLDRGPQRLSARALELDLDSETGTFHDASAYLDPDFYLRGESIEKVGEDTYVVHNGVFTSCADEVPAWSFRVARARVTVDGYARATHTAMRIQKLPILYLPYIVWPVKDQRTSGFLVPNLGYSDHRGTELGLAYFQTFGDSYDATLHLDLYEKSYRGYGAVFRYRPSQGTSGSLRASWVDDRAADRSEQRLDFVHDSRDLPAGLRGVVRIQDYSDYTFFAEEFERRFDDVTRRSLYSSAYLSGSWGTHSVNLLVDERETFDSDGTATQRQLPELEYVQRTREVNGTPLYFSLRSSAHVIDVEPREGEPFQYERTDWIPELSLPFSRLPWLSMTVSLRERFTWYGDSVDEIDGSLTGDSLTRSVPSSELDVVGPSFQRIYDRELGSFSGFKHLVEPQITYTYARAFEEQDRVLQFDEIDSLGSSNVVTVKVVNRLLARSKPPRVLREALEAKPAAAEEEQAVVSVSEQLDREQAVASGRTAAVGAFDTLSEQAALLASTTPREILSLTVEQRRTFDEDCPLERPSAVDRCPFALTEVQGEQEMVALEGNLWGRAVTTLRFNPSDRVSLDSQITYSPLFSHLSSTSLSTGVGFGRYAQHSVGTTWYTQFDPETGVETSNQLRLNSALQLWPDRLRLGTQINYDVVTDLLQSQSYNLTYTGSCYGLTLTYRDVESGTAPTSEIFLSVSLKNVGNVVDLSTGQL